MGERVLTGRPAWRDPALGVLLLALVLFGWTHREALSLFAFSDDVGLLYRLSQQAAEGTLWPEVRERLWSPLWAGAQMWRPWPYASFALDAQWWSGSPNGWRLTNLALHLCNAALTALLLRQLQPNCGRLAMSVAFAAFLLMPWVPEVTLWLVGRFDGWVTFGILLALVSGLRSVAATGAARWGWMLLSALAAVLAYASKESAPIILPWLLLMLGLRRWQQAEAGQGAARGRSGVAQVVLLLLHAALWGAYFYGRQQVLAGASIDAYGGGAGLDAPQLAQRLAAHTRFPLLLAPLAPLAALFAALLALRLAGWALRLSIVKEAPPQTAKAGLLALLMWGSVLLAAALYFDGLSPTGEGYRLYYLGNVGLALLIALGVARQGRGRRLGLMLLALLCTLAYWQRAAVTEWVEASRYLSRALPALGATRETQAPEDYGLVLMRDALGRVPAARNAQAALLAFAQPASPAGELPWARLVVFTPPQFEEWWRLVQEDVVRNLTGRVDAPAAPTQYYCYDAPQGRLQALGHWPAGDTAADWQARWEAATRAACPDLL